jgi:hypothetical protein
MASDSIIKAYSVPKFVGMSHNQEIVNSIADVMRSPPSEIDGEYVNRCVIASSFLGLPTDAADIDSFYSEDSLVRNVRMPSNMSHPWGSVAHPINNALHGQSSDEHVELRNRAMAIRNNVVSVVDELMSFMPRAYALGFASEKNPFVKISSTNSSRDGFSLLQLAAADADSIVSDMSSIMALMASEKEKDKEGKSEHQSSAAQLSSVRMSFDGFGGSRNAAVDLLRFTPGIDLVRKQKSDDRLGVLDFKQRMPVVLFVADYVPESDVKGAIVGWKKIPDASGYIVKRRNVFDGSEKTFTLSNDDLRSHLGNIKEYLKSWIMTFYDTVGIDSVCAYLDNVVYGSGYYQYTVQAYQSYGAGKGSLFSVESYPSNMSETQRIAVRDQLQTIDQNSSPDAVNPYPILAQQLLGDSQFDWVLAGVNSRVSVDRRDSRTLTRQYSYLGAKLSFLFDQMSQGKFVVPRDVNVVIKNVTDRIATLGVTAVVLEIVQDTGALYHFEGQDVKEDFYFDRIDSVSPSQSNLFSIIAASIDPETALVDVKTLVSNLFNFASRDVTTKGKGKVDASARPTEIEFPKSNVDTQGTPQDEISFLRTLSNTKNESIDLNTFDGLSKLMRILRVFFDFGINRGKPLATTTETVQTVITSPTPPPPPSVSPVEFDVTSQSQVVQQSGNPRPNANGVRTSIPPVTSPGSSRRG